MTVVRPAPAEDGPGRSPLSYTRPMDLTVGFDLEDPALTLPWFADEAEVRELVPVDVERVADGFDVFECVSLGGLRHAIGLHYLPRSGGQLREIELFRREPIDPSVTFPDVQRHLEAEFGPPSTRGERGPGRPCCEWRLGAVRIVHLVRDRLAPEEFLRITHE